MVKKLVLVWFKWFKMHALMNFNVGYCSSARLLFIGLDTRLVHGSDTGCTRNGRKLVQTFHRTPGVRSEDFGRDQAVVREVPSKCRWCPGRCREDISSSTWCARLILVAAEDSAKVAGQLPRSLDRDPGVLDGCRWCLDGVRMKLDGVRVAAEDCRWCSVRHLIEHLVCGLRCWSGFRIRRGSGSDGSRVLGCWASEFGLGFGFGLCSWAGSDFLYYFYFNQIN